MSLRNVSLLNFVGLVLSWVSQVSCPRAFVGQFFSCALVDLILSRAFVGLKTFLLGPIIFLMVTIIYLLGPIIFLVDPIIFLVGPINFLVGPINFLVGPINFLVGANNFFVGPIIFLLGQNLFSWVQIFSYTDKEQCCVCKNINVQCVFYCLLFFFSVPCLIPGLTQEIATTLIR